MGGIGKLKKILPIKKILWLLQLVLLLLKKVSLKEVQGARITTSIKVMSR